MAEALVGLFFDEAEASLLIDTDGGVSVLWVQSTMRRSRPYTPRPNGEAERFIQAAIREWAYARTYQNSDQRQHRLDPWLHDYNFHRQRCSLNHNTQPLALASIGTTS